MILAHAGCARPRRMRAWRALGVLMTAAALLPAAGCGHPAPAGQAGASPPAARHQAAAQPSSPAGSRGTIAPIATSFTSASAGWLLAAPPCAQAVHPCRTLLLRKTDDGGRSWLAVPAPPAPGSFQPGSGDGSVSQIVFTSSRDGWAWGPGLWQTRDGSATWRRLSISDGPVQSLAAGGGRVLAATGRCGPDRWQCSFKVYSSPTGADNWRPIPGAAATRVSSASLAVSGQVGYVFATATDLGRPLLLTGPVNGSARWRSLPDPCPSAWSMALAAAGGWLFLSCGSEPGAGSQVKTAYLSGDGGRTWHQAASPPASGYLGAASMTPAGTIFLSGGRMDIYVSRDRGRSWHTSPSLDQAAGLAEAGFSLWATATSATQGFAFQEGVYQHQTWLTGDSGRHWTAVTVH
jgi:hypothetical protein